jgi:hypothetical protein
MSNRRKLRPHEIARRDQTLASARNEAQMPGTLAIVGDIAPPEGTPCSWCDCPVVDSQGRPLPPHDDCGGCAEPAACVMTFAYGTPDATTYALCAPHYPRFIRDTTAMLRPRVVELPPAWMDPDGPP